MDLPFDDPQARTLNKQIFETIYHGAVEASCELAEKFGYYETYPGSPISQGKLQFDLWGVTPSNLYDWDQLRVGLKSGSRIKNPQPANPQPASNLKTKPAKFCGFSISVKDKYKDPEAQIFSSSAVLRSTTPGFHAVALKKLL